jgi:hypothetical protein
LVSSIFVGNSFPLSFSLFIIYPHGETLALLLSKGK